MTKRPAWGRVAARNRAMGIHTMDIGFIGLGNMGQPMARRLIEAGYTLVIYDTRNDAVAPLVALGAKLASSPADVADRVETVMASLPSLQISEKVALGEGGVIHGKRVSEIGCRSRISASSDCLRPSERSSRTSTPHWAREMPN